MSAAATFRAAVEARDLAAAEAVLHPDVEFCSPVVHRPYTGRDVTMAILREVVEVFEDFRYVRELHGDEAHGLVFEARVGDRRLEGWDLLETGEDGLVTRLTVMVRPLSGLQALADAMGRRLAAS